MKNKLVSLALFALLILLIPVAAAAQSLADQVAEIEIGLVALFPLVILISSLILSPEAVKEVKELLPAVVGVIVSVIYFIVEVFPGFGAELVVQVGLLIGLATKLYDPLSALIKLVSGLFGRRVGLNDLTGPGFIGRDSYVEGD